MKNLLGRIEEKPYRGVAVTPTPHPVRPRVNDISTSIAPVPHGIRQVLTGFFSLHDHTLPDDDTRKTLACKFRLNCQAWSQMLN